LTDFIHIVTKGVWGMDIYTQMQDVSNPIIYQFSLGIPKHNGTCKTLKVYYFHLYSNIAPKLDCTMTLTTQWDLINLVKQLNCFPIGQPIIIKVKMNTVNGWGSKLPLITPTLTGEGARMESDIILQCVTTIQMRNIIDATLCKHCYV
jgi:hypothetical protein